MVVAARADVVFAVNGWLRSFPELTSLVDSAAGWTDGRTGAPRISGHVQDKWKMPTRALTVYKAGGPVIGEDYALGLKLTRIRTQSYAASAVEADGLWAMLDAILVPTDGRAAGFTLHGARIATIEPEPDAALIREPDTGWLSILAPYLVRWISAP